MLAADRVAGRYYGKAEELFANIGGLFETIGDWLAGAAVRAFRLSQPGFSDPAVVCWVFEVAVTCSAAAGLSERAPLWNEMIRLFSPTNSAYPCVLKRKRRLYGCPTWAWPATVSRVATPLQLEDIVGNGGHDLWKATSGCFRVPCSSQMPRDCLERKEVSP